MVQKKPNIILVTVDSLRADYSIHRKRINSTIMSFLSKLSRDSLTFVNAYSVAPYTTLAIPSIMTGKHPLFKGSPLIGSRITLAEYLRSEGYITVGIVSNNPFARFYSGNGKGFTIFHEIAEEKQHSPALSIRLFKSVLSLKNNTLASKIEFLNALSQLLTDVLITRSSIVSRVLLFSLTRVLLSEIPVSIFYPKYDIEAIALAEKILNWIVKEYVQKRPIFLWIHLMSTHMPYSLVFDDEWRGYWKWIPRKRFVSYVLKSKNLTPFEIDKLRSIYEDSVKQADRLIEQIFLILERVRLLNTENDTYIIITADHGEELFEHGEFGHKCKMIEELLRVPLVIWGTNKKGIIESLASNIDIFPTIIDLINSPNSKLGKQLKELCDGKSLLITEYSKNNRNLDRKIISECINADEELFIRLMIEPRLKIPWRSYPIKIRVTTPKEFRVFTQEELERVSNDRSNDSLLKIAKKRYQEITGLSRKDSRESLIYRTLRRIYRI